MRIMVLGTGRQGRAALHDLARSEMVSQVIAVDANISGITPFLAGLKTEKIQAIQLDLGERGAVSALMQKVDAVINLLPVWLQGTVAELCVANRVHLVDTSYASPVVQALSDEATDRGLTLLPEFGFDPGIDLVLAGQACRELDEVHEYFSYGTGLPEPEGARKSPIGYKISWSVPGLLKAYTRDGRILRDGKIVEMPGCEMFAPENIHMVELAGWGPLEAYVNGDAVHFVERMGIRDTVRNAARLSARWPGHCAFWYSVVRLGLLDETPIAAGGAEVAPREIVRAILEKPEHQFADGERDIAIARVDMRGLKDGRRRRIIYDMCDLRDLDTGLMAMARTVGFTASIGAQMILRGDIRKRGLLSPLSDIPVETFLAELQSRGISVKRYEEEWQ